MNIDSIIIWIVGVVMGAGGGWYGHMKFGQKAQSVVDTIKKSGV